MKPSPRIETLLFKGRVWVAMGFQQSPPKPRLAHPPFITAFPPEEKEDKQGVSMKGQETGRAFLPRQASDTFLPKGNKASRTLLMEKDPGKPPFPDWRKSRTFP